MVRASWSKHPGEIHSREKELLLNWSVAQIKYFCGMVLFPWILRTPTKYLVDLW